MPQRLTFEQAAGVPWLLPLDQAAEAHREGEKGHTRGKIVLRVRDQQA
jgi:hypothetical protein